jgi:hypothetical protein
MSNQPKQPNIAMPSFRVFFSSLAAVALGACASVKPMPSPQPSWAHATGQIQTSGGAVDIVGEIAIRYDDQHFLAEISKGPSLPLLRIYAEGPHGETVTVRGALARGTWSGPASEAPDALKGIVALPEVFQWAKARAAGDKSYSIRTPDVKTGGRRVGKDLTYLEYTRLNEKIVLRLQP